MIVMHQRQPRIRFATAISKPKKTIQITFTKSENMPLPYTISLPNGHIASDANLKHCKPIGIPMIVMHQISPASSQRIPLNNPPKINQRMLPNVFIMTPT